MIWNENVTLKPHMLTDRAFGSSFDYGADIADFLLGDGISL